MVVGPRGVADLFAPGWTFSNDDVGVEFVKGQYTFPVRRLAQHQNQVREIGDLEAAFRARKLNCRLT